VTSDDVISVNCRYVSIADVTAADDGISLIQCGTQLSTLIFTNALSGLLPIRQRELVTDDFVLAANKQHENSLVP